jgi:hypothetical protein
MRKAQPIRLEDHDNRRQRVGRAADLPIVRLGAGDQRIELSTGQHVPLLEQASGPRDLLMRRAIEHQSLPMDGHLSDRTDSGRTALLPPRTCTEIGCSHLADEVVGDTGPPRRRHLARLGEPLGDGEHRGHRKRARPPAVVELARHPDAVVFDFQLPDCRRKRQVQQLGNLRAHLTGIGVDRVASEQDEVPLTALDVPALLPKGRGDRSRGGQRVGTCEQRITDEHGAVGAPCNRLSQHVDRRWRAHCEHDTLAAVRCSELDSLAHCATAVGVHLKLRMAPVERPVRTQPELLGRRDLLHEHRDVHVSPVVCLDESLCKISIEL